MRTNLKFGTYSKLSKKFRRSPHVHIVTQIDRPTDRTVCPVRQIGQPDRSSRPVSQTGQQYRSDIPVRESSQKDRSDRLVRRPAIQTGQPDRSAIPVRHTGQTHQCLTPVRHTSVWHTSFVHRHTGPRSNRLDNTGHFHFRDLEMTSSRSSKVNFLRILKGQYRNNNNKK